MNLHPDLLPYYHDDGWVHHPLLIGSYSPDWYKFANESYLTKRDIAEKALRDRNWWQYVFIYERPYRLDALRRCRRAGLCGREYWEQLGMCWRDSENIRQNLPEWRMLWRADDEGRDYATEEEARPHLAALPEQVEIYRGCCRKSDRGLAWTSDRDVAEWFARRNFHLFGRGQPYVLTGFVRRGNVLALDLGLEREIVSDRVRVTSIDIGNPEGAERYQRRRRQIGNSTASS